MVTPDDARMALRAISKLAGEQAAALDKAFRLFGDGALIGAGAERLYDGMVERHQMVQRAFLDAFHSAERAATASGGPAGVAAPYPRPAPAALPVPAGGYVGGNPDLIQMVHDELGRTGMAWQEAGGSLSEVLAGIGVTSGPGQNVAQAGSWLLDQRSDLQRRRAELLKAPPVPSPEQPTSPPDKDSFTDVTDALTSAVDWAGDLWADTVQSVAGAVGVPQVGKIARTYADRVAKPLWQGAAESTVGLIKQGWQNSPIGVLTDWNGYLARLDGYRQAGAFAARDPIGFLKQVSDWKTLTTDPARWFGRLVPDITIAAVTAGASTGATSASKLGATAGRVAEDAGKGARAPDTRGASPPSPGSGGTGPASPDGVRHGPSNPGPLADKPDLMSTFRSGSYSVVTTTRPTTLYRVYGGTAGELGTYWTTVKPSGPVQSILDSALFTKWGNTATKWVEIRVPPGVTYYEGIAAEQGGLAGGGTQVVIPQRVDPNWIVDRGEFPMRNDD